ncbi:cytochrome-c peroxidase [Algibacter mikhailovii]|uniref:Cytochrome-c peroxidase n=1 Tax=Algibacter mikhailovii TaxID=425498 RepID=A0A918VE01_9FLAO|nr:cytochrome c peroxidase [Algibacter mikhailovii]GGZ90600.1 cytochrome-c peroxidase [Algibacter mikhailovii]
MKIIKVLFKISFVFILFSSCKKEIKQSNKVVSVNNDSMFNDEIRQYYFQTLDSTAHYMKRIDTLKSIEENRSNFLESRKWYKYAEPLLIAYDYENYLSMNAPNLLKVEMEDATEIKKIKPKSYQVLEEYLFGDETISNRELYRVYYYLQVRIPFVRRNHIIIKQRDRHHLKMIRDGIVNIATKGITGFDSPILANSLTDAVYNYETIKKIIYIYKNTFKNHSLFTQWITEIDNAISFLKSSDFDEFDRYSFIKHHTNRQLELINNTATDWNIQLSQSRALNPTSTNIFSETFFNKKMFSMPHTPETTEERVNLGKTLFNDKALSISGTISCATCHVKEKAFTDGHKLAIGLDGTPLQRNSPTLVYAMYQKTFFYDGRASELEGQIVNVANNENEFHIDLNTISKRIEENPKYQRLFDSVYNGQINHLNVRNAIATYIRSLTPFDSKFDRNMQNLEKTLSKEEILGFNLFMGKAACATCHFPPTFYGTVPPKFDETEFENIGITRTVDFNHAVIDEDPGLYYPFEVEERRHFFKTATIRNIALTAPYMHNGAFETLEEVLEFYNSGGGQGLGLDVPYQTLPSDPLNLEKIEIDAIIAFMKTLTDQEY